MCSCARRTSSTVLTSGWRSAGASCWSAGARTRCVRRRSTPSALATGVDYIRGVGWEWILEHERDLARRFLDGLPEGWRLHGPRGADDRTPTFAITHEALAPADAAARLAESGFAVWHGNYYAVEIMERLGLADGAVRVGIVHYNTAEEVDRLLAELERL